MMRGELENIKEAFREEKSKLEEVVELTKCILESARGAREDASIRDLLNTREGILREIMLSEESIFNELRKAGRDISYLEREFSGELESIRDSLQTIQSMDSGLVEILSAQKEAILEELKQIKVGQVLPNRYKKHENGGPSFINIKE